MLTAECVWKLNQNICLLEKGIFVTFTISVTNLL